jgi:rhodanese-related sulfurtransferase
MSSSGAFDPSSETRLPIADYELQVILICQEGYASSLAAASLEELGIHRAADVIGGYAAWQRML